MPLKKVSNVIGTWDEDENGKPRKMYMYAPNCYSESITSAILFRVAGAARMFGDKCLCHEGDFIEDSVTGEVVYEWGKNNGNN